MVRCFEDVLLLDLQETSRVTLKHFGYPAQTSIWAQGWLSTMDMGLEAQWVNSWDSTHRELRRVHIWLRDEEDELVWAYNYARGYYITKLGCEAML
jgi:hypothetical protein